MILVLVALYSLVLEQWTQEKKIHINIVFLSVIVINWWFIFNFFFNFFCNIIYYTIVGFQLFRQWHIAVMADNWFVRWFTILSFYIIFYNRLNIYLDRRDLKNNSIKHIHSIDLTLGYIIYITLFICFLILNPPKSNFWLNRKQSITFLILLFLYDIYYIFNFC